MQASIYVTPVKISGFLSHEKKRKNLLSDKPKVVRRNICCILQSQNTAMPRVLINGAQLLSNLKTQTASAPLLYPLYKYCRVFNFAVFLL